MKDDCKTPYTGTDVRISGTSPYAITAYNQVILGYQTKLCLACSVDQIYEGKTIPNSQIATSKFTVTQQSKCMTTLSMNSAASSSLLIDHDSSSYNGTIYESIEKRFVNSDAVNCPYKTCKLLQKGC